LKGEGEMDGAISGDEIGAGPLIDASLAGEGMGDEELLVLKGR
jgi:hypothetical protein